MCSSAATAGRFHGSICRRIRDQLNGGGTYGLPRARHRDWRQSTHDLVRECQCCQVQEMHRENRRDGENRRRNPRSAQQHATQPAQKTTRTTRKSRPAKLAPITKGLRNAIPASCPSQPPSASLSSHTAGNDCCANRYSTSVSTAREPINIKRRADTGHAGGQQTHHRRHSQCQAVPHRRHRLRQHRQRSSMLRRRPEQPTGLNLGRAHSTAAPSSSQTTSPAATTARIPSEPAANQAASSPKPTLQATPG